MADLNLSPALLANNQKCSTSWLQGNLDQTLEYLGEIEQEQPSISLKVALEMITDCARGAKLNLQYLRETGYQF